MRTPHTKRPLSFSAVLSLLVIGLSSAAPLLAQSDEVVWTGAAGVSVSGNSVTKTAVNGWNNAGAISQRVLESSAWVEFTALEANTDRACGLAKGNTDHNLSDVDFAIRLLGSGTAQAYESGAAVGSSVSYQASDRFRVEAGPWLVRYFKNGALIHTSTKVPAFPLLVDTALYTQNATLTDVRMGDLAWTGDAGVTVSGTTLTKTGASSGWNAGAASASRIEYGDGYLEFTAVETTTARAAGLNRRDTGPGLADIDYALVLGADGVLSVQENGVSRGSFGSYAGGDRLRVEVLGNAVRYLKNGDLLYASTVPPQHPLAADTALDTPGATLADLVLAPLVWTNAVGVSVSGTTLVKTNGAGWNSGAASTTTIPSGDGYLEFTALETTTSRALGLASSDTGQDYTQIDFAVLLTSAGQVEVHESGVSRGSFGSYAAGDRFRIEVSAGVVKYRKNTAVFYTSGVAPSYPLLADASLDTTGATLANVVIGDLVFKNDTGLTILGTGLAKTASLGWGNAGASTTRTIAAGDGAVEFVATGTTTRVVGLSNGDANQNYTEIDYGVYLTGTTVFVYENGTSRGSFGTHAPGDRLRVAVENGVVRYRRNGVLLYTSTVSPTYPLLADTALYDGRVAMIRFESTANQVVTPALSPGGGTYTTAQTVTVSTATSGAEIRYTTDGSEPNESSPLYTGPLSIGTTTTLRAKAYKAGLHPSETAAATYQMNFGTLAAPTMTPGTGSYESSVEVTLSAQSGATIRYTTNGTEPTASSTACSGPLTIAATTTLKAKAFHPDYTTSATTTRTYTILVATPTLTPDGGTYAAGTVVTVSTTPGADIHYTLDGAEPTTNDLALAPGGTLVAGNYTLKAKAWKTGCTTSGTKTAAYTVTGSFVPGAVAAGTLHSVAVRADGTVWAWGANGSAQLGDGTTTSRYYPGPVAGLTGVVAIAAGDRFTLALRNDGTVWTWGWGFQGRLGLGDTLNRTRPVQLGLADVVSIAAGKDHGLAALADGTAWAWGTNASGQLGDGTTDLRLTPVQVTGLTDVARVGAGDKHSLAVKADGSIWAWGSNAYGGLGDGTTTQRLTPVKVGEASGMAAVDAGYENSFAIRDDGVAWSWGYNNSGALGDRSLLTRLVPVRVAVTGAVVDISGGSDIGNHALAATSGGSVWSWGSGLSGELGDGLAQDRPTPEPVAGVSGAIRISAGPSYSLALTSDGSVWAWGYNLFATLGDGTAVTRLTPVRIAEPGFAWKVSTPTFNVPSGTYYANQTVIVSCTAPGATIRYTTNGAHPTETDPAVASGGSVVVDRSLTLKARAFKAGMPASNVASAVYTLKVAIPAVTPGGGVYTTPPSVTITTTTTGAALRYTTDGSDPTSSSTLYTGPVTVGTTTTLKARGFKADWADSDVQTKSYTLSLGTAPAPALDPAAGTYEASVSVTMSAIAGATIRYTTDGFDPTVSSPAYTGPVSLTSTTTVKAKAFHPDYSASATTTAAYTVQVPAPAISPGSGTYAAGQAVTVTSADPAATLRYTLNAGDPTATDLAIESGSTLTLMTMSGFTLKVAAFKAGCAPSAVVSATYTVTGSIGSGGAVAGGGSHSLALKPDGTVLAWGQNWYGQVGDASTQDRTSPVAASGLTGVTAIAAGSIHSLALRSDGTVWAWGSNVNGRLGDGTTTQRTSPVQVSGLSGVVAIAAGEAHSLAVKSDGTVWAWGANGGGRLGDGTTTDRWTPVQVSGLTGMVAVAAGSAHSLALQSDGTLRAWGQNWYGEVGDGTTTQRLTPVQTSDLTGVVGIAAGSIHSLALKGDGTVWAWGANGGRLGDGTVTNRLTPVLTLTSAVLRIAAGSVGGAAVRADGTVVAWGGNPTGQVGDGTTQDKTSPVRVVGLSSMTGVGTGSYHGLAVQSDGTLWAWGSNQYGSVGDGTTENRLTPVRVLDPGFALKAGTPMFSPVAGTYSAAQTVTLTSATAGATIHYTTTGADPTTGDPSVGSGGTVNVDQSLTLKARAVASGLAPSNVGAAAYVLTLPALTVAPAGGTYTTPQTVTISSPVAGATIRYELNGSTPTESSTLYTGPFTLETPATIRAAAWKIGWQASGASLNSFSFQVAQPALAPDGGAYSGPQTVTVTTATPGAVLHYTTDGREPTESSPVVASGGTVAIGASGTLMVKGWRTDWTVSATKAAAYAIVQGTAAAPTFSPAAGTYTAPQTVTLASATPGAVVRYTTDGSEPALSSPLYTGPILVDRTTTIKAKAFRADWTPSATATAAYTIDLASTVAAPALSPAPGRYTTARTVTLTTSTAGALIHYTTTGLDPTEADPSVASGGTVLVDRHTLLKAKAFNAGMTESPLTRGDYRITGAVAAGYDHVLAVKTDGTLWSWGSNGSGQLGLGNLTAQTAPVQVPGLTGVVAVSAVVNHGFAMKGDGNLWGFGGNGAGQLGTGNKTNQLSPVQVAGLTDVVAVATGNNHTLALLSDGTVKAWGYNYFGAVGDGTTNERLTPVSVLGLTDVVAIAAGADTSFAVRRDGTLWSWGRNVDGAMGNGGGPSLLSPAQVPSLRGVVAVAAGSSRALAIQTDGGEGGTVWAWGTGGYGIGDGSLDTRYVPVAIATHGKAIAAEQTSALIVRAGPTDRGSLLGVGLHYGYQLTGGVAQSTTIPVRLTSGSFAAVAAGSFRLVALRSDTSLLVWGNPQGNGFVLGVGGGGDADADPDGDGLTTAQEWDLGTDPYSADTNGDGIPDGIASASGKSATNPDMDGDGVPNAVERERGTDPFLADTDGDGVGDGADCFPLDPTRWQCPPPIPGDVTPPTITLTEPTNATLQSSTCNPSPCP